MRGYAICTAPRSGSNWLCQLLTSTGVLGRPLEYFNGPARRELDDPSFPDDPRQQLDRVFTQGATANGVYGLKLFAQQRRQIEPTVDLLRDLPNVSFVFLRRRDVLGQAISWAKALQTLRYRSTQPQRGQAAYSFDAIAERLRSLDQEYADWAAYFGRHPIRPLEVYYEDMLVAPQSVVDKIAKLVGVNESAIVRPTLIDLEVQRDEATEEWRRRFFADQRRRSGSTLWRRLLRRR
ncbi:MAG TPA: Stf0 family sulfotransferase [Dehalococcoidia bacterium]|nr:Stf0 family sulfotransferase [Dehalococcoidia bacterium]